MFDNETVRTYYYTKFLQSCLYDDDIYKGARNGSYDFYIFNSDFLAILINYIAIYVDTDYAYSDLDVKDRLYTLINYIRNNAVYQDDDTKKYYCDIFNDLVLKLNQMSSDSSNYEWVFHEITIRTDVKLGRQISYKKYKKYEEFVRRSLGYDFILLTYLSDEVDEETFDNSIESLANDEFFFASLNVIIKQCPELLQFPIFKTRVKKVIDYNRKHMDIFRDEPLETKIFIIKQNNKHYKRFNEPVEI